MCSASCERLMYPHLKPSIYRQLKHFKFSYMFRVYFLIHVYFISKAFISNTKLTAEKNQVKAKHHPEAELFSI